MLLAHGGTLAVKSLLDRPPCKQQQYNEFASISSPSLPFCKCPSFGKSGVVLGSCLLSTLVTGIRHQRHYQTRRRGTAAEKEDPEQGNVLILVGSSGKPCPWGDAGSPVIQAALNFLQPVSWLEAIQHLVRKVLWIEPTLRLDVRCVESFLDQPLDTPSVLFLVSMSETDFSLGSVVKAVSSAQNLLVFSSEPPIQDEAVSSAARSPSSKMHARASLKTSKQSSEQVLAKCYDLWSRSTTEDAVYSVLFAIHFAVAPVKIVTQEPAIDTLDKIFTLCTKCFSELISVAFDGQARSCLQCQSECDPRDQTQMYRCTVRHESEALSKLVRCFERRGVFDCNAQISRLPDFEPVQHFRREVLSHELAWKIMEGHWNSPQGVSWRPVLGQNPAYDYFPCQLNSWYRDPSGNRGWYDPVFKVVTLDGQEVWRKRHYRVLPGSEPGSFNLSTEDNGVSLREFWRIVDVDDNLSWAILHYTGAAPSVGQSYSGSLLVSKDGQVPADVDPSRISAAFLRAGVAPFELYPLRQDNFDTDGCEPPPITDFKQLLRYQGEF